MKKNKEKQAHSLWASYHSGKIKEEAFWAKYETLLLDTELEASTIQEKIALTQSTSGVPARERKKRYYAHLITRLLSLFVSGVSGGAFIYFVILMYQEGYHGIVLYIIMLQFFVLLVIVVGASLGLWFCYIGVAKSGIYIKNNMFSKPKYFAWAVVNKVELLEEVRMNNNNQESVSYNLLIHNQDGVMHTEYSYQLSKSAHHTFVLDIKKQGGRFVYS